MTVNRAGSSEATAPLRATVFPDPTSPVTTPIARLLMHHAMRAAASRWEWCWWSMDGARFRPKGTRVKPKYP